MSPSPFLYLPHVQNLLGWGEKGGYHMVVQHMAHIASYFRGGYMSTLVTVKIPM